MIEVSSPVSESFLMAAGALRRRLDTDGGQQLLADWRSGAFVSDDSARMVAHELLRRCRTRASSDQVSSLLSRDVADVAMVWAESVSSRGDLTLAPLLSRDNAARTRFRARAARARLLEGPLFDALSALPSAWDTDLGADGWIRLRQLIWEAGARGVTLPGLGRWVLSVPKATALLITEPARGHLGERVLAARALSSFAEGFVEDLAPALTREVLKTAIELRDHAEPLVWRSAALGLGRFALGSQSARATVFRSASDERLKVRRRNLASIGALPVTLGAESWVYEQLAIAFAKDTRKEDPWQLAALAVATPHLVRERPDAWARMNQIAQETPAIELTWSLAQGLAMLARHDGSMTADEGRVVEALHDQLNGMEPSASNEIARTLDASIALDRARGREPTTKTCFDQFDARIRADIEGRTATEPDVPRLAFDDAMARSSATTDLERATALLGIRAATRAHAMHLPELVLGLRSLDVDSEHMVQACRERLASETCEYGLRSTLVGAIGDLVAGAEVHGRAAANALRAIAESRWVLELAQPAADAASAKQMKRDMQRFRKPFEDLFETCLAARPALASHEGATVPPVVAAWWALCAGPAAVLGSIDRLPRDEAGGLEQRIARLEAVLRDAGRSTANEWGPRLIETLRALSADDTALFAAVHRLVDAMTVGEVAKDPATVDRAPGMLAGATRRVIPPGGNLDDAFGAPGAAIAVADDRVPSWVSAPKMSTAASAAPGPHVPWERLGPGLAPLVGALSNALVRKLEAGSSFVPAEGVRVGNYVLISRISKGGMGEIWRATAQGLPGDVVRPVALKLPRLDAPKQFRPRLARAIMDEARNQAHFSAARVSTMLDYGVVGDVPYLVTALLRGRTVEAHLIDDEAAAPAGAQLPLVQRIVRDMCIGLDNIHRHGIIHRDPKPANVILRMPGRPADPGPTVPPDPYRCRNHEAVLIDLGIAHKFYETGAGEATVGYAAPELFAEVAVGPAADIYALGATLFHILTGQRLTGARQGVEGIAWHVEVEPFEDDAVRALSRLLPQRMQEAMAGACRKASEERISLDAFRRPVYRPWVSTLPSRPKLRRSAGAGWLRPWNPGGTGTLAVDGET